MKSLPSLIFVLIAFSLSAQDKSLPYYEMASYPETFTAGSVASRMIDGLGFRFYWATEGLRESDLAFKPGKDARTSLETITHIYEMSFIILNSSTKTANVRGQDIPLPYAAMRKRTLENFKNASDHLRAATDQEMKEFKLIFKQGDQSFEFPFWHQLNGPIADCIWHTGQLVSFRRSSGNPFNETVDVFSGKAGK
jgi:hypothetical protein